MRDFVVKNLTKLKKKNATQVFLCFSPTSLLFSLFEMSKTTFLDSFDTLWRWPCDFHYQPTPPLWRKLPQKDWSLLRCANQNFVTFPKACPPQKKPPSPKL